MSPSDQPSSRRAEDRREPFRQQTRCGTAELCRESSARQQPGRRGGSDLGTHGFPGPASVPQRQTAQGRQGQEQGYFRDQSPRSASARPDRHSGRGPQDSRPGHRRGRSQPGFQRGETPREKRFSLIASHLARPSPCSITSEGGDHSQSMTAGRRPRTAFER
jgi:hypothetical protein